MSTEKTLATGATRWLAAACALAFVGASVAVNQDWDKWRQDELAKMPKMVVLNAPYTPFLNDSQRSVNLSAIPDLAADAANLGANLFWVPGGMGQFYTMSTSERNNLVKAWADAVAKLRTSTNHTDLYVVANVGTTVLNDAVSMAAAAKAAGADAVATVPPYYEKPSSIDEILAFLKPIAEAAYPLPLWYYHIPGTTGVDINAFDLLNAAADEVPQLLGIKYVSSDTHDWFNCVQTYNSTRALLFAAEPKLQWFGLGLGRGAVIAEDFYSASFLRMVLAYLRNDHAGAQKEMKWKFAVDAVFSKYGGTVAKRAVYQKLCNVDMGPRRLPTDYFDPSNYAQLVQELEQYDFFKQAPPTF